MNRLVERGIFDPANRPNHVLVNEYLPGQGIMPHTDGPAFHPVVATLSLGEHTVMDFRPRRPGSPENGQRNGVESSESPDNTNGGIKGSVFLPRRSLIILADTCYSDLMHGILNRNSDTLAKCQLWNWDEILQLDLVNVVRGSDGCECIKVDRVNTRYSLTVRNVPKVVKLFG